MTATYIPVGEWGNRAACRNRTDDMTMPTVGRGYRAHTRAQLQQIETARTVCAGCPVRPQCHAWVLQTHDPVREMVAAGMTPAERAFRRAGIGRIA